MTVFLGYLLPVLYLGALFGVGCLLRRCGVPTAGTRKFIHIFVGGIWCLLHVTVGASMHAVVVCLCALVLNLYAYRSGRFSLMSSEGDNAPGTVYYALAMTGMAGISAFFPESWVAFGMAVFFLSFGDGLAGVLGMLARRSNPVLFGHKTVVGTLTCFAVCLGVALAFDAGFSLYLGVPACLVLACFAAECELVGVRGLDNLVLPLGTFGLTCLMLFTTRTPHLMLPLLLTVPVFLFAVRRRALTPAGLVAAVVLDVVLSVTLGNEGFLLLLLFFSVGLFTDLPKKRKLRQATEKGNTLAESTDTARGMPQVLANAGVFALFAVLFALFRHPALLAGAVAAMAEALGDTAASGVGALSPRAYDLFHGRRVAAGESGGMSLVGTLAALAGAAFLGSAGGLAFGFRLPVAAVVIGTAFLGTVFDSFLGSVVQAKYLCPACGARTEQRYHCGTSARRVHGLSFFDNNMVNFLSTLFSALVAFLLLSAFS